MWIENRKSYRIRQSICVILGVCASLILTCAILDRQKVMAAKQIANAQERLADEVFRFHVLANSDSDSDQKLKLKVRDYLLSYMKETMCEQPDKDLACQDVKTWTINHLDEIEQKALEVISAEGYQYTAKAKVEKCYFPDRKYGNILFPKGYYEALRIEIGKAEGHNWWCVLYPSLCFTDATCAVVAEEGEEELEKVLDTETYETVTITSTNFKIKSFFYELFKEKTKD